VSLLLLVLPLLGVLVLNLPLGRLPGRAAPWVAALFCVAEGAVVLAAPSWLEQPLGIDLPLSNALAVDKIALVMFLAISIVCLCALLVAKYTFSDEENGFRFSNLLLLSLAGMNGIVLARDLFSLYVFLEITAVSSFVLIALEKGKAAFEGAFKYMLLSAVATALILAGISLLFVVAGNTSFAEVAKALGNAGTNKLGLLAVALFLGGLGIKAGLVPFHGWLPDAYSLAPAPVSVLLAGIVTKTTGVYTLIRLTQAVFDHTPAVGQVLLATGTLSIVVGALLALPQSDLKRMLAYSSISQVGYIILGLGAGSALGTAGAVLHLFNHAIFKTQLFVNAAAVEKQSGTRDMDQFGGIADRMPVTGTTSVIAMLSTAGIPPLSGFWSKLFIIVAVWKAGQTGYALVAVLASVITLAYFLSMQRRVFFGKLDERWAGLKEANLWALSPALLLTGITLALGLAMPWLFDTFLLPVGSIL
jgi:multicomponent Na+:H+ antiporter subunit D